MSKLSFKFKDAKTLLDCVLDLDYFHPNDKGKIAIPFHRVDGNNPLVVITGDNASGKSFLRRLVCAVAREAKTEAIHISMEGRRNVAYNIGLSFVYGDENIHSTGQNSVHTVLGGITTCRNRETPHVMFWDEPDLGLSDSWAAGMGRAIRQFTETKPKHTKAILLVTHSKALVSELLPFEPHFLYLGEEKDPPKSLTAWFEAPVIPKDIEKLPELSSKRFKLIAAILNTIKERKESV